MNVVGSPTDDKSFTMRAFDDAADVSVQMRLEFSDDERLPVFSAEDDVRQ